MESLELPVSRFNDKYLLQPGAKIPFYCIRDAKFFPFFDKKDELVFCKDNEGILTQLGIENYVPEDYAPYVLT